MQACADPNTLFRANSLASKAVDYYMKHVGADYLEGTRLPAGSMNGTFPAARIGGLTHAVKKRAHCRLIERGDGARADVLKGVIDTITSANRSCEIDPSRVDKGEDVESNQTVLESYISLALDSIFSACEPPAPHAWRCDGRANADGPDRLSRCARRVRRARVGQPLPLHAATNLWQLATGFDQALPGPAQL